jgi:Flp pilus assembly protein TadG
MLSNICRRIEMRSLKSIVCDEGGEALIEFAIAAGIFFTLIFGIIGFCLVVYTGSFVAYAAQHGSRYAMVRGSDWTNACASASSRGCQASAGNVQDYVLSLPHPGINLKSSDISVSWPGTSAAGAGCTAAHRYAQGCQVNVTVSYTFSLRIPGVPAASIPLSSTSIETIQN